MPPAGHVQCKPDLRCHPYPLKSWIINAYQQRKRDPELPLSNHPLCMLDTAGKCLRS